MTTSSIPVVSIVAALTFAGACARAIQVVRAPAVISSDSLRGVLAVTGSEPQVQLVLRQAAGTSCTLREATPSGLRAAQGLEVTAWGTRDVNSVMPTPQGARCGLVVSRFAVRAADGNAAVDGILRAEGSGFVIEVAGGERRALTEVPAALRSQVGARIFWVGPQDRPPSAYGVILPAK